MAEFKLTIRTPEKEVFSGSVRSVSFHTEDGQVQVLAHHASYMATVQFSTVKIESESESRGETLLVRGGIFNFDHKKNEALLLCQYSEEQSEISYQTAAEYLSFLTEELAKGDLSEFQVLYLKGEKLAVEKQVKGKVNA